jgi:competence protein ComEC
MGGRQPSHTWGDRLRRGPALGVAILLIAGIASFRILPADPLVWTVVSGATLLVAWVTCRSPFSSVPLAIAIGSSGVAIAQQHALYWPASDVSSYTSLTPRMAQLELRLTDPLRTLSGPPEALRPIQPRQVTTAEVTRVLTWDGWRDVSGRILVQIEQPHPRLAQGQTVRAFGLLQRPAPAANPGQFDWASYYREQGVLSSVTIPLANGITILDEGSIGWIAKLRRDVRQLLAMGFEPRQSVDHALLRALLVGDGDPELRDITEQFKRTGTSHHLAISGLHVAVLGGVVYCLCRSTRMRPRWTAVITTAFVVLYGLVALPSPPVVRSVLLCAMFALGVTIGRGVDGVQLLSVTAIAMLLYHPADLFAPGFQLSVGTVFGLIVLTPTFTTLMQGLRDRDAMLAPKDPGRLAAVGRWADSKLLAAIVTGVVAWLVSMPLIAWHFGQINPWAIVFSILLGGPVFASLIGGLLKVVLTFAWPSGAGWWADMAARPVGWMRWMLAKFAAFPGADVPLPAPPWYLLAACYALLLASVFLRGRPGLRWTLVFLAIGSYLTILAIPIREAVVARVESRDDLRVTLLSVGAGQCAVIEPPGGRTTLVDAGSTSLTDLWRKCLGPYLHFAGKTSLDTVLVSHGDVDHISGVGEVASVYGVREVLTGAYFAPNATGNPAAENLLSTLDAMDRPPRVVYPGETTPLGRDTRIDVLWPPKFGALRLASNDGGLVVKITHAGRSILFPADIQDDAMRALLKTPDAIKADVLIAPHHGSSERTTEAFVAAVDPVAILSSNDRTLTNKQRVFETLIGGRPLYRTNRCGAVTVVIRGDGTITVEPFLKDESVPAARTFSPER